MIVYLSRAIRCHPLFVAGFTAGTLVLGLCARMPAASAEPQSITEVEAAFVYQFTRYVEWPEESFERAADAFSIVVVGDRPLAESLSRIVAQKGQDGRPFRVTYVDRASKVDFAHILYVSQEVDFSAALEASSEFDGLALTIGQHETFTREGGVVRLYLDDQRLRIEVNIDAAQRAQFKISSKLLDLARIVRDEAD